MQLCLWFSLARYILQWQVPERRHEKIDGFFWGLGERQPRP
jgi:hypothetical protein